MSFEYECIAHVYNVLSTDAGVIATGVTLHPSHHAGVKNPVYPLATYEILSSRNDRLVQEARVEIAVYSEHGMDEKWAIFGAIEAALVHKAGQTLEAYIINARRVYACGADEYEQRTLYVVIAHFVLTGVKD